MSEGDGSLTPAAPVSARETRETFEFTRKPCAPARDESHAATPGPARAAYPVTGA